MGNGVSTFFVTYVDRLAAAQVRFARTGHAESTILRHVTPVVCIEGYPMCRSVLVTIPTLFSLSKEKDTYAFRKADSMIEVDIVWRFQEG